LSTKDYNTENRLVKEILDRAGVPRRGSVAFRSGFSSLGTEEHPVALRQPVSIRYHGPVHTPGLSW